MPRDGEPQALRPFNRAEVLSISEAAFIAKRSKRTVRDWALLHDLGRRIGGQWVISKVALAMHLNGDREALSHYRCGNRTSPVIVHYFELCGVPLPRSSRPFREGQLSELNGVGRP